MNRQTIRYPDGAVELKCSVNDAVMRLAAYEDTGLEPEVIRSCYMTQELIDKGVTPVGVNTPVKHLFELAEAESEGRLTVLPSDSSEMAAVAEEILSRACRLQRGAEAALGGNHDA